MVKTKNAYLGLKLEACFKKKNRNLLAVIRIGVKGVLAIVSVWKKIIVAHQAGSSTSQIVS